MSVTLDQEAAKLASLASDIDNFRERFTTENDLFVFPSFELATIEKNFFFLLQQSRREVLDIKYKYRPDYLSFDEYGTVGYWQLLLLVNGIPSLEDFDIPSVIIPSYNSIIEILRDRFPERETEELTSFEM